MTDERLHRALVLRLLEHLPPVLEQEIISSREFQERYDVATEARISLGDGGVSFRRSAFYDAVRALYGAPGSGKELMSDEGVTYTVSLEERAGARTVVLTAGERRLLLPALWFLSPIAADRLAGFDQEANRRHLVDPLILEWRERLARKPLEDSEVDDFHQQLKMNPGEVAEVIAGEIATGTSRISALVPPEAVYYERLIGPRRDAADLVSFVELTAAERLRNLLGWNFLEGLRLALLICPQSLLTAAIEVDDIPEELVIEAFDWLKDHGDRFSQVAGTELGLRLLDRFPGIKPLLREIVADILRDNPDDPDGRLMLSASLAVFTDGELARLGILRSAPPYYRRLAALAQASLIERELIAAGVASASFGDWAREGRGQSFFLQSLIDLRLEPRWLPDFMSAEQLRYEFLGRISAAAAANSDRLHSDDFREMLIGDGPDSVSSQLKFPFAFLPGPLEGGQASPLSPPSDFEGFSKALEEGEITEQVLAPFVNVALIFRFEKSHAESIATALKARKYQVAMQGDSDRIFSLLVGLATIASVTRSTELADEVRILARVMRRRPGVVLKADSLMRIGMIAAAADAETARWSSRVGDWLTELSLEDMDRTTAVAMRSHVRRMCELEPRLWKTCAKADAALSVFVGMAA